MRNVTLAVWICVITGCGDIALPSTVSTDAGPSADSTVTTDARTASDSGAQNDTGPSPDLALTDSGTVSSLIPTITEPQIGPSHVIPSGAVYYVDKNNPAAADTNPGTASLPWYTVQHAANTLVAGETVLIRGGTIPYITNVEVWRSGSSKSNMISFIGDPSGPKPVFDNATFRITGASYIRVARLRFENIDNPANMRAAIKVEGDREGGVIKESHGVIIQDNEFYNLLAEGILVQATPWGMDPWHPDPLNPGQMKFEMVEDVTIRDNHMEMVNIGGWNEQITISNGVKGIDIGYNTIKDGGNPNGGEGIDLKEGCSDALVHHNTCLLNRRNCFYIDGGRGGAPGNPGYSSSWPAYVLPATKNIHIYGNVVKDTQVNGSGNGANGITLVTEGVGNVEKVYIYNNVIDGAAGIGLSIYLHPDAEALQTDPNPAQSYPGTAQANTIWFVNNTVINGGNSGLLGSPNYLAGIQLNWRDAAGVVVKNNIVFNNGDYPNTPQIDSRSHLHPGLIEANNLTSNPQFEDLATGYSLTSNAVLAIDQADPAYAPTFDLLNAARGSAPDIGAVEYAGEN